MIKIPNGQVGSAHLAEMRNPLYGNRTQWFTYELLDNGGAPKGSLANVTGGSLEWHANAAVKGGGKISVRQPRLEPEDWLKRLVKIEMHIEGLGAFPLGVFVPSAPTEKWDDVGVEVEVELLDKCSILDNDYVAQTYSLPAGTNVTEAVRTLITSTGERAGSITDSSETLNNAMTWEGGTSKLAIINDLLSAANFFSLRADGNGHFRVERKELPRDRPLVHEFRQGHRALYLPAFAYEKDIYSIPNKVVMVGQGSGDQEALVAVATNENPNSPYSFQQRSRWIVDVTTGVEATSQEALNSKAAQRLHALTSPTGTLTIDHAPLPWLNVSEVVKFHSNDADIDIRGVIQSTKITLDATALQHTEIQEVAEL